MKKILTLLFICVIAFHVNAQQKEVSSFISYGTFNITEGNNTPYLETYITFDCNSLVYVKNTDGKYEASINLTVIFKQGEEIKNYDKYTVTSPAVDDTTNLNNFFIKTVNYI